MDVELCNGHGCLQTDYPNSWFKQLTVIAMVDLMIWYRENNVQFAFHCPSTYFSRKKEHISIYVWHSEDHYTNILDSI